MINSILQRAEILIGQRKYREAEEILKKGLSQDPNHVYMLSLLSQVSLELGKKEDAEQFINSAIGLSPDSAYLFFIKAQIALHREKFDQSEKLLEEAIALDAGQPDFYAYWAMVKLSRKQYREALELADHALTLDAEHILALNTRSTALIKLDRKEDSYQTIEGALKEDPNNPYTHANYGWNLLEKGDHKKALVHFREALKANPNLEYAQAGMVEALKAANPLYRLYLKYAFWIGNLTEKYQWGVIIGFYLLYRVLQGLSDENEHLKPFLTPILFLMAVFAFSTWVITPISNLFLRLNKYGKHLLDSKEIMSSNFVGISLLLFLCGVVGYLLTMNDLFIAVAVYGFAMMVPLSVMFSRTRYGQILVIYAGAMAVLGAASIFTTFAGGELINGFSMLFLIGFVAFQWIANFLVIRQSNR